MRNGFCVRWPVLGLAMFPCWFAHAEPTWKLEALVQRGLAANAELRAYEAAMAAAKGQREQAGLWQNPQINGDYGHRRVSDSAGASEGFTRSLSLTQTFEFPGKASLRQALAAQDVQLAELGLRQFRLALRGQIKIVTYQYIVVSQQARIAEEIRERCQNLIELLGKRPSSGTQQFLELKVIEGSLFESQKSARDLSQSRDEALIELRRLLGLPKSQFLEIDARMSLPPLKIDSTALVRQGLSGNIQLKLRLAEVEKAIKGVASAKLEAAPDFSVGPFFRQDKAAENEVNIGASISTTLPVWNWGQGNLAASQARRAQADALLLDARSKVESELLRRLRSFELTQRQLRAMPESTLTSLREAADLADRQYRTGAIGIQLFLETQRAFLGSQNARNELVLGAWRDLFDLELLTGGAFSPTAPIQATEKEGRR